MKFTLGWLKEHLETDAPLSEITDALTDLGLELEGVQDPAATLGAFTIARVIEAKPHPNADRLRVCRVQVGAPGSAEEVQVVCGAPNARTGMTAVFAPPGTHVPGTGMDLKPGVIRGEASNGMLCSGRELQVSDDHDGILDLPDDAPLGARYIDWAKLNDPVIEIAVTPNRPDALGVAGVARDLAARGLGRLITPAVEPVAGAFPCPVTVTLGADVADRACPLFMGRLIRGVRNGASPDWLQRRLRAIGLRPISRLVDVTNLLTFDRARPLHVFDAGKLQGGLRLRLSTPGETVAALNDATYTLDDAMTTIYDDGGPVSIAGVIGGAGTGCDDATTEVFIEAAYFDPIRTAATGRKLKIVSDARYRFERGIDPAFTADGLEMATRLILDLCGGEPSAVVTAGAVPADDRRLTLRPARAASLVGMAIPADAQAATLRALGFGVAAEGEALAVTPPSWRPDVRGEADLVEEVARVASLSGLQATPLPPAGQPPALSPGLSRARAARRALAAAGLRECVTYSFVSATEAATFGGGGEAMALENPISSEMSHMRPSPLPGLLAAAARNAARDMADAALFEVGPAFDGPEPGQQRSVAAGLRCGGSEPRHWSGARRPVDALDARADAEAALAALGVAPDRLQIARAAPGWLHPGRSGVLKQGRTVLAVFGELHPKVVEAADLRGPVVAFEVDLDAAPAPKRRGAARPALAISDLQPVERDFAFVVDAAVEAEAVMRAARGADRKLIAGVSVFDVFAGPKAEAQLGAGRKSVALSVRLQPVAATLTDADIEAVSTRIVADVLKATGASLRGG